MRAVYLQAVFFCIQVYKPFSFGVIVCNGKQTTGNKRAWLFQFPINHKMIRKIKALGGLVQFTSAWQHLMITSNFGLKKKILTI